MDVVGLSDLAVVVDGAPAVGGTRPWLSGGLSVLDVAPFSDGRAVGPRAAAELDLVTGTVVLVVVPGAPAGVDGAGWPPGRVDPGGTVPTL